MSSDSDQGPTPSKKKAYDLDFKLKAVNCAEEHSNNSKAARDLKVNVRQIRKWRGQKTNIEAQLNSSKIAGKRLQGAGRPVKDAEFDD